MPEPDHRLRIAIKLTGPVPNSILDRDAVKRILDRSRQMPRPALEPLYQSLSDQQINELLQRAVQLDPNYQPPDLSLRKQLQCPLDVNPYELAAALKGLNEVETAYVMRPGPPPAMDPSNDLLDASQGYLDPAPAGIDVRHARKHGGDGNGIGFVDLEQGWNLNHEDLAGAGIALSGVSYREFPHGTRVMGIVLMQDNAVGGVGIAPSAQGRAASLWLAPGYAVTPDAILLAISMMNAGDVLLLEVQEEDPVSTTSHWPAEITDDNYLMIRCAAALQIVVVEAAGNGVWDLDAYHNSSGDAIFDRGFRDSGAILVGAATSAAPHARIATGFGTNYGHRVDCYAWGEKVATTDTNSTGTDNTDYEYGFDGTSAASAIVAGAALVVQSLAVNSLGRRLSPLEMRTMLTTDGTPSADPATDLIGVMPNLQAIIDDHL